MIILINTYKRLFDLYLGFYQEDKANGKTDYGSFYRVKLLGMLTIMNESGVIDFGTYCYERDLLYENFN